MKKNWVVAQNNWLEIWVCREPTSTTHSLSLHHKEPQSCRIIYFYFGPCSRNHPKSKIQLCKTSEWNKETWKKISPAQVAYRNCIQLIHMNVGLSEVEYHTVTTMILSMIYSIAYRLAAFFFFYRLWRTINYIKDLRSTNHLFKLCCLLTKCNFSKKMINFFSPGSFPSSSKNSPAAINSYEEAILSQNTDICGR